MKRTEIKRRPLSDTVLANLEPESKEYRELDGEGLYFRVKPDGKKAWLFRSLYTTNFTEPLSYQDSAFLKLPKFP
ncbi:Arm DNA-binding domain-containing protein, partial [Acinetobacter baumannii]